MDYIWLIFGVHSIRSDVRFSLPIVREADLMGPFPEQEPASAGSLVPLLGKRILA